jgi:hypothetical protein
VKPKTTVFDAVLKDAIEEQIRVLVERKSQFLDLYPPTLLTRWQRYRLRVWHWWWCVRHSVCCSHEEW